MRETVEIIRKACAGEKVAYDGQVLSLPRPGGSGKPLRISQPPARVPIYLATLAPYSLRMTGEIADGWLGTSFTPDAPETHLAHLRAGAEKAGALWLDRKRDAAAAAVPDHVVMATAVLGDTATVERRLARYAEVGIDLLMVHPLGPDEASRLDVLGQTTELARRVGSATDQPSS